jgi:hypothetical protein
LARPSAPSGWVLATQNLGGMTGRGTRRAGRKRTMAKLVERLSVLAFAAAVVLAIVGLAFAAGYVVGQLLL